VLERRILLRAGCSPAGSVPQLVDLATLVAEMR
jgi:hypothetical protein